jgi:hypothetical protein
MDPKLHRAVEESIRRSSAFDDHLKVCKTCKNPRVPMCAEGRRLWEAWMTYDPYDHATR